MNTMKQRQETQLDQMLRAQMELLYNIQDYKTEQEYKTISMNMATICRELNNLRIKEITNERD